MSQRAATFPGFWDNVFPGHGEDIAMFIRRFINWDAKMQREPPNIAQLMRDAIFWKKAQGTRIFGATQTPQILAEVKTAFVDSSLAMFAVRNIGPFIHAETAKSDGGFRGLGMLVANEQKRAMTVPILIDTIRSQIMAEMPDLASWGRMPETVRDAALASVVLPCALVLAGKRDEAAKFMRLQDIVLSGVQIYGYDRRGKVLVRVVD